MSSASAAVRAPVAQLDRALPSEGRGQRFESSRVRHFSLLKSIEQRSLLVTARRLVKTYARRLL